jgi:predicted transcriptional regulator
MNREIYLRNLIDEKYASIREFSKKIDLPYTTVMGILERGVGNARLDNISKICKGLDISPADLSINSVTSDPDSALSEDINFVLFSMLQVDDTAKSEIKSFVKTKLDQNKIQSTGIKKNGVKPSEVVSSLNFEDIGLTDDEVEELALMWELQLKLVLSRRDKIKNKK